MNQHIHHGRKIVIIAGPNGAGKTTFAEQFLPHEAGCPVFINAGAIYDNSGSAPRLLAAGDNP
ncbi:MAG: hypothetical protein HZA50_12610 [Planctomycetes bacterium]|nr:hypothetical protein [Planctomycetota bacterium]